MKDIMPTNGQFGLMQLPYADLGESISAQTLAFHHGKHLKTYVDNLNNALVGHALQGKSLQEVVLHSEGGMLNNAGQVLNHTMYFEQFCPGGKSMSARMEQLIVGNFGSVEAFCTQFAQQGGTLFGSGWVWLSADAEGRLVISQEANAGNPLRAGLKPLLTFDVWEHAYYLDYQNRRADYLKALWGVVDWSVVESRL